MAVDARWSMWVQACDLLDRADQQRRSFFALGERANWAPPIDVMETGHHLFVMAALPGVDADALEVSVERGRLRFRGRRPWPDALLAARVHRLEIPHGVFERVVPLPAGTYRLEKTTLTNGCLTIKLLKGDGSDE